MIKALINIAVALVPNRPLRRRLRLSLLDDYESYRNRHLATDSFKRCEVRPKSVLIVEPNGTHAVVLPGFVEYFRELGYSVDVMLRPKNAAALPFARLSGAARPRIFIAAVSRMKKLLRLEKVARYDYCFLSTTAFYESDLPHQSYLRELGFEPAARHGLLLVEHDLDEDFAAFDEGKFLDAGRLFTLPGFQNTPMLNPHRFGDVAVTPKSSASNFIIVGGIEQARKNFAALFDAMRGLIASGREDFTVTVVGKGRLDVPEELRRFVSFKGSLKYPDMYAEMERADFLLALLDPDLPEHNRYRNSSSTGTILLSLGFVKPCLMDAAFAGSYGLDGGNAVVYSRDLGEAMRSAMDLDAERYDAMQSRLAALARDVRETSRANLEKALEATRG